MTIVIVTLVLAGCGGGSDTPTTASILGSTLSSPAPDLPSGIPSIGGTAPPAFRTLSGVATVGTPIVGGNINAICSSGNALATTTDSTTGAWTVTLSDQALPCAVQVSGGTINGAANTTLYHSIATSEGNVNVTPLTELVVANLVGSATPNVWFAGLSATPASLTAIDYFRVNAALGKLSVALGGLSSALNANNPITTPFTPTSGNIGDDMLIALATAMSNTGVTYASLLSNAAVPAVFAAPVSVFGQALLTAYRQTASGSIRNTTTYTIGGTVSGLASTVVLQYIIADAGGDPRYYDSNKLSINANGAFSFAAAGSSAYYVTVFTQPPGQTCSVSAGIGPVMGNLNGMVVSCAAVTDLPSGYAVQGGLTWMPVASSRLLTWPDADAYCTGMIINGQTGWRLPTSTELSDLYQSGAMNGQGWALSNIWTSTPADAGSHYVTFLGAPPFGGSISPAFDTINNFVTCVH